MEYALAMSSGANGENVSVSLPSNKKTDELSEGKSGSVVMRRALEAPAAATGCPALARLNQRPIHPNGPLPRKEVSRVPRTSTLCVYSVGW